MVDSLLEENTTHEQNRNKFYGHSGGPLYSLFDRGQGEKFVGLGVRVRLHGHTLGWLAAVAQQLPIVTLAEGESLGVPGVAPQLHDALFELLHRHATRPEVHIKESASVPSTWIEQPTFRQQSFVQPCAGERRQYGDLHLQQTRPLDEIAQFVEDGRRVSVETDDETAAHAYTPRLNLVDHLEIAVLLPGFPVDRVKTPQTAWAWTLEADENLPTAAGIKKIE